MDAYDRGKNFSRRDFFRLGAGAAALAAGSALLRPAAVSEAAPPLRTTQGVLTGPAAQGPAPNLHLVATDGWININAPAIPPFHPDNMAPAGLSTYIFGFRNVTGFNDAERQAQKMRAQLAAPLFIIDENQDYTLKLTNLGLQMRPDLIDSHTVHFHGFRNQIPIFDGEPHTSVGVPIVRDLTYFYRPRFPGTYMYHCHFEETEHVHMGMTGPCFVRPALNQTLGRKFAYNDEATEYDREFVMMVHEFWAEAHWADSHVQLPEWTDYRPDLFLLNGRAYPDTLLPNGQGVTAGPDKDLIGPLDPVTGQTRDDLRYQPVSSLVTCNTGDRVLLRFINLGFSEVAMRLAGIRMWIVGRDATPLRGRDGTDQRFVTNVAPIGPGESADAIFVAPPFTGAQGHTDTQGRPYDRYLLYNRALSHSNGGHGSAYSGQMTEVRVYPAGILGAQTAPNA